jgi:hypothetical protein
VTPAEILAGRVPTDPRERRVKPWLPVLTRPGRVYVAPGGETYRARADGGLDAVLPGGYPRPGISSDPTATRSAP